MRIARGAAARKSAEIRCSVAAARSPSFALTITPSSGSSRHGSSAAGIHPSHPWSGRGTVPSPCRRIGCAPDRPDADVAVRVGVDEVLARAPDLRDGVAERGEVLGRGDPQDRGRAQAVLGTRPPQGERTLDVLVRGRGDADGDAVEDGAVRASRAPRAVCGSDSPRTAISSRRTPVTSSSPTSNRSCTSPVTFVAPQACRVVAPSTIPGANGQRDPAHVVAGRPQVHRESRRPAAAPAGGGRSPAAAPARGPARPPRPTRSSRGRRPPAVGGTSRRMTSSPAWSRIRARSSSVSWLFDSPHAR